jgi:hypothetical protein
MEKTSNLVFLEVLGKGGSGQVVKCFDKNTWQFYAYKIEKFNRDNLDLKLTELKILKELMDKYPNEISNIMGFKIENLDDLA